MAGEWNAYRLSIAVVMVVTGSINTLAAKWADRIKSKNSVGEVVVFDHPFLQVSRESLLGWVFPPSILYSSLIPLITCSSPFQACVMFLGEMCCLSAFLGFRWYQRRTRAPELDDLMSQEDSRRTFSPLVFLPPAMCDMTATSLMYLGLTMTYASSFQMLRGAVIIFTALLSVAFLGRVLQWKHWIGILCVFIGLCIVGLSDMLYGKSETHSTKEVITGDLLIIMAQVIAAVQMVYEEKYVYKYGVSPLLAVGLEGTFGFLVLATLLIPFYYIPVGPPIHSGPRGTLEDAPDGLIQIYNSPLLMTALTGTLVSIAFFNFAGISVTKEISATTRMVLDSIRTLIIWLFALAIGWQKFQWLQIVGFIVLVIGMAIYNNLFDPLFRRWGMVTEAQSDRSQLIASEVPPSRAEIE
ncbi:unnamed protein product [Cyprideis torosa]|uniref:Uncharacterized protein n=1 Tax=Cyprideis torosa TaxID=163714 RepID=A0A7R8WHE6_9CRUS|nr:unnamed protein product [Cyprideis torosa]CAG0893206.1 unnamed protein product [Cyprideis torosa]